MVWPSPWVRQELRQRDGENPAQLVESALLSTRQAAAAALIRRGKLVSDVGAGLRRNAFDASG